MLVAYMHAAKANPDNSELTAWGRWIKQQSDGALTLAMRETGLSWFTVSKAQKRLVSLEVAEILAGYSGGAFRAADMTRSRVGPRRA